MCSIHLQIVINYTVFFIVNSIYQIDSHRMLLLFFCQTLVVLANLWLQLVNENSSKMNIG